ncbi:hypothetical protein [Caballeronia choica]|jgi:hypothetical protein|uniref:hypothetical protein n=1 Tax=Caballeronia choica TaxID=326476 RepID=UPI000AB213B6|nr:hypothetical protein [Caballeronia choica]
MAIEPNLGILITTFLDTVQAENIFQVMLLRLQLAAEGKQRRVDTKYSESI